MFMGIFNFACGSQSQQHNWLFKIKHIPRTLQNIRFIPKFYEINI